MVYALLDATGPSAGCRSPRCFRWLLIGCRPVWVLTEWWGRSTPKVFAQPGRRVVVRAVLGVWVEGPVGFPKLETTIIALGDMPSVFVDKPVVKPTQQDQIVEIGFVTLAPGDDVVNLQPVGVVTTMESALAPIAVMDLPTQPSRNRS